MNISDLLKLWRVEKGRGELAKMPPNLYKDGLALTKGNNPYEAKKSKDIYSDLIHMRQHKMLMGCLRQLQGGDKPENMLAGEKSAYNIIFSSLKALHDGVIAEDLDIGDVPMIDEQDADSIRPDDYSDSDEQDSASEIDSDSELDKYTEPENQEDQQKGDQNSLEDVSDENDADSEEPTETEEEKSKENKQTSDGVYDAKTSTTEKGGNNPVFKGETENKGLTKVRFLRPMPAFVGPDMKSLGPFEEDQETELDADVVEILLTNDAVELI